MAKNEAKESFMRVKMPERLRESKNVKIKRSMANKIVLGMAVSENIRVQTVGTLIQLFQTHPDMGFIFEQGPYVSFNREEIAARFMNGDGTHLFFLDSDMMFEPDVLDKLLAHDKDIVGARYYRRQGKEKDPAVKTRYDMPGMSVPNHLYKNYATATGCMLIKREALARIPRPWFALGTEDRPIGEDIYFCAKAKAQGIEIWEDPTLSIGHVGLFVY